MPQERAQHSEAVKSPPEYADLRQFKMKRNPRKLKWTKAFRHAHGKEMTVDSTLTFAARRNIPMRYSRDHLQTTLKAIERVTEIRQRRERVFYKKRMAGNKERQRTMDRKLVEENQHLLPLEYREKAVDATLENVEELSMADKLVEQSTLKQKKKQRMLTGGGTDMDVD